MSHLSWDKKNLLEQSWIHSPAVDLSLILLPALLISTIVLCFHEVFTGVTELPVWVWAVLIVGIDVAHVYATLFRTYLNPIKFQQEKALFIFVPMLCWFTGTVLYTFDPLIFWRTLAYLAVFHFIRQQYGFMAIYSRKDPLHLQQFRWLDALVIYLTMLYPLAYWHVHLPRHFNWFLEGDFFHFNAIGLDLSLAIVLSLAGILYLVKEIYLWVKFGFLNIPRNLLILGTTLSWTIGIVAFDNDLIFTATNVISHGIPYMALVWIYGQRHNESKPQLPVVSFFSEKRFFSIAWIPFFLLFLFGLAYLEEGLWDGLIWQEHGRFFSLFSLFPIITDSSTLSWLIPLLALPQMTHYVLDGFIWRMKSGENSWYSHLFGTSYARETVN